MFGADRPLPPPGRTAIRWFLFLVFFHLVPIPWYMAVVVGLAPAAFLLALGLAGLFNTDSESLVMAGMLLVPALLGGLALVFLSYLLAAVIGRLKYPAVRSLILLTMLAAACGSALFPIYLSAGHSGGKSYNLLDFLTVLESFRVSPALPLAYFAGLTLLLSGLLVYQHTPERFAGFIPGRKRRRTFLRWGLASGVILFVALFCWVHRVYFFVYPLAQMGFPSAQYRLAMVIREQAGSEYSKGVSSRMWLERAAAQGHLKAALALARYPRSAEDKLHWLTIAADGGLAEAQYQLYRLRATSGAKGSDKTKAGAWLRAAADGGNPDAQFELGRYLVQGDDALGIMKDSQMARQWWEKAAGNEHGRAMAELAKRYQWGTDGFIRDPRRAANLLEKVAEGYRMGRYGLPENEQMAAGSLEQAEEITALEERVARGDPEAQATLGRQLLGEPGITPETTAEGVALMEKAGDQGRADVQYELGAIFFYGSHGIEQDYDRGRRWWDQAVAQRHVPTMERVAPAYQKGQFGYPVDLLKSKSLIMLLVAAYREGLGVEPDAARESYWTGELKYLDRLFVQAGGDYQPLDDLRRRAEAGETPAQYQLARQLLIAGPAAERKKGLIWLKKAAEGGDAEAQYRLVTYYENQAHLMRDDPARGTALLRRAAEQNHLRAMGELALAYEKGRNGLAQDFRQAENWYRKLLDIYASGRYLGDVDDRFINFQRRRLAIVNKAGNAQEERTRKFEQASPLERRVMEIEDSYHKEYERAVNNLDRRDGSPAGKALFRAEVERLRLKYAEQRDAEIEKIRREAAEGR